MERKHFFSQAFRLFKGKVIETSLPEQTIDKLSEYPFRPLGVRSEHHFLQTCESCPSCVSACPHNAIEMCKEFDGKIRPQLTHTSHCISCQEKPCISSCTTGALSDMGTSYPVKLTFQENNCISYMGSMCQVCYDYCPQKEKAITLRAFKPVFNEVNCTGCRICSEMCVTGEHTIKMRPSTQID